MIIIVIVGPRGPFWKRGGGLPKAKGGGGGPQMGKCQLHALCYFRSRGGAACMTKLAQRCIPSTLRAICSFPAVAVLSVGRRFCASREIGARHAAL